MDGFWERDVAGDQPETRASQSHTQPRPSLCYPGLASSLSLPDEALDLRGASRPPSILIRRRPSNAGRETPRTPALSDLGSGAISWNRYPGRDRYPLGRKTVTPGRARLTTQPKLSGAQRGGFFPTGGEIRPGGGSNPPPVECRRLLRTTWANNLRHAPYTDEGLVKGILMI